MLSILTHCSQPFAYENVNFKSLNLKPQAVIFAIVKLWGMQSNVVNRSMEAVATTQ